MSSLHPLVLVISLPPPFVAINLFAHILFCYPSAFACVVAFVFSRVVSSHLFSVRPLFHFTLPLLSSYPFALLLPSNNFKLQLLHFTSTTLHRPVFLLQLTHISHSNIVLTAPATNLAVVLSIIFTPGLPAASHARYLTCNLQSEQTKTCSLSFYLQPAALEKTYIPPATTTATYGKTIHYITDYLYFWLPL